MLWTSSYLARITLEAEVEIAKELECIIDRYSLATEMDLSEYQLPDYVNNIRRVFWKGERLDPISGSSMGFWNPSIEDFGEGVFDIISFENPSFDISSVNVQPSSGNIAGGGKPRQYFYSRFGENVIKFSPSSNESILTYSSGLYSDNIANAVIIEFYRMPDGVDWKIPEYIRRRTIKAYVLWKAFQREGDGQNIKAANYWFNRYQQLMVRNKYIINNVYKVLTNSRSSTLNYRELAFCGKKRGPLPANYGIPAEDCWCDE